MTVKELYLELEKRIPSTLSANWDHDGLQVTPDENAEVTSVVVALDVTLDVIAKAKATGANVIVTHHPVLFHPAETVNASDTVGGRIVACLQNGISVMSFHTRLDAVDGGVNDALAALLGLTDVTPFGAEGIGRIGKLKKKESLRFFAKRFIELTNAPGCETVAVGNEVKRVAVLGGAGSDELAEAKAAGADTYVTGEVHYNVLLDARETGVNLLVGGHYYTENPVTDVLKNMIGEIDPSLKVQTVRLNVSNWHCK